MNKYTLDAEGTPVATDDILQWGAWFETADRKVAMDEVNGYTVSTVFLSLDHNWTSNGPPVLWETMVFGRTMDDLHCERYTSRAAAVEGHARMVGTVKTWEPLAPEPAALEDGNG